MKSKQDDELARAIEARYGCAAKFEGEVAVEIELDGAADWDGKVSVYSVNHSEADTCYAWSMPFDSSALPWSAGGVAPNAVFAMLRSSVIDSPAAAVRSARDALTGINGEEISVVLCSSPEN